MNIMDIALQVIADSFPGAQVIETEGNALVGVGSPFYTGRVS